MAGVIQGSAARKQGSAPEPEKAAICRGDLRYREGLKNNAIFQEVGRAPSPAKEKGATRR
jgi:hypothetical protein